MSPEEIARRLVGVDKDNNQIDYKSINNYLNTKIIKSRKVEINDNRAKNITLSKEARKTVALRLRKKLIERGRTPNLGCNFYALTNV